MSRVLVTGAGGYIGAHVVSKLLDLGQHVIAADICLDQVDERAEKIPESIFREDVEVYSYFGSPDVCIHLAWRNGFVHNAPSHMEDLSSHCKFIRQMIQGGLQNLAVMGTMHEVGYWEGKIDENTPCNPLSQYGIAKNALRQFVLQLTKGTDINVFWLRAFYIVGDDARNHSIFSKILQMEEEGKETFPFTSGKNKYDFIDVDTLAFQIAAAAIQKDVTGVINVCSGIPISLADRVNEFIREKKLNIRPEYGAFHDREYDSPGIWGDSEKIRKILGNMKGNK